MKLIVNQSPKEIANKKIDSGYVDWHCRACGFRREVEISYLINISGCLVCSLDSKGKR